uniref:hypothetical protein n=1 Tax=Stenotrophomonas maltophilia TaxID=40324 RepID=UPI001952A0DA
AQGRFIVSTASTPSGLGGGACAQQSYLDAMVPSVVVPQCWTRAYRTANPQECASIVAPADAPDLTSGDLVAVVPRRGPARVV